MEVGGQCRFCICVCIIRTKLYILSGLVTVLPGQLDYDLTMLQVISCQNQMLCFSSLHIWCAMCACFVNVSKTFHHRAPQENSFTATCNAATAIADTDKLLFAVVMPHIVCHLILTFSCTKPQPRHWWWWSVELQGQQLPRLEANL